LLQRRVQPYWTLQVPEERTPQRDAPQRLEAALQEAVADRIADRVTGSAAVVFMSGGLDSTALAAIAREVKPDTRLLAGTSVYRTRIPDVEESYAAEAARAIGIPIRFFVLDEWSPLQSLESGTWTAEPGPLLTAAMTQDIYARAAEHAPLALHGHPADAVLYADLHASSQDLLRKGRLLALSAALIDYVRVRRRPPWFVARRRPRQTVHPLQSSMWSSYFEWAHPLLTRAPIELAYPWCDLRVVEAALAMPPFPWLVDKHVLREVLRGRVSEVIRTRPKSFLQGDPWTIPLSASPPIEIEAASVYVDRERFLATIRSEQSLRDTTLRAVLLEYWMRKRGAEIDRLRSGPGR
jgi:asparagine synthase (glutamine-hydrolysing)